MRGFEKYNCVLLAESHVRKSHCVEQKVKTEHNLSAVIKVALLSSQRINIIQVTYKQLKTKCKLCIFIYQENINKLFNEFGFDFLIPANIFISIIQIAKYCQLRFYLLFKLNILIISLQYSSILDLARFNSKRRRGKICQINQSFQYFDEYYFVFWY